MADVAGALGLVAGCLAPRCLESGFAVGSSEALKPLLSIFPPASPFSPSAPSVGWSGVRGRKREGGRERGRGRGTEPSTFKGLVQSIMISIGFHGSYCLHPAALFSPLSPWQHFRLNRILTLQWGILQIKGDIFGTLPSWHFVALGEGANF